MTPTRRPRRCRLAGLALCLACAVAGPARAATAATPAASAAASAAAAGTPAAPAELDPVLALEHASRAQPAEAIARLGALLQTMAPDAPQRTLALALRGALQAQRHDADGVAATLHELEAIKALQRHAEAAALYVRAAQARDLGPRHRADRLAQDALDRLDDGAPPMLRWQLLKLRAGTREDGGDFEAALRLRHEALALADRMGEPWRRCDARGGLAYTLLQAGQVERGRAVSEESLALARAAGDELAISRALNAQTFFLAEAGDAAGELAALQGAIVHARRAQSPEDAVLGLANLADYYLKRGEFDTALRLAREALPLARELGDRSAESVALGNIGLALISLHQLDEGLRYTRESMALEQRVGALTNMARFELEIAGYLERAGYLKDAVAVYQRQRKLADEVSRRDQQQAVVELQEGHDHERRQRELDLLQREQDLQQARLLNQTLTQRLWAAGALAALLLVAVGGLLLLRLRRHNAQLKQGNARLRELSEQDVLTGLANRHHLHRLFQAGPGGQATPFEGTLMLIDIDHFKRINDRYGHAAGDRVLVETARRLRSTLREPDLIARWGGEEFLVVAPALSQDQLEAMAQRLLGAVADRPVALDGAGTAVDVTASIGYASFPTPPHGLAVGWERALGLVDTALYLAKAHGRNLAYGVCALHARDEAELTEISHALETSWRDGRVQLSAQRGPQTPARQPTRRAGSVAEAVGE